MPRVIRSHIDENDWTQVSQRQPCPLCDATTGCQLAGDGQFVCCARRPSDWRLTNGAWLHRVDEGAPSSFAAPALVSVAEPRGREDANTLTSVTESLGSQDALDGR